MNKLLIVVMGSGLALAGAGISPAVLAEKGGHMSGHHMMGKSHHGGMSWKHSLSDEQRTQLMALKLEKKKNLIPLKLKIKQAKVALAMLVGSDNPNQGKINKKISEIVKLKEQKMLLKARHRIAVRKLLNAEQKVQFDLHLLKKATHGKRGDHGYHGRHH